MGLARISVDVIMAGPRRASVQSAADVVAIEGAEHLKAKEGKIVDFFVYVDSDGLGAEECRPRQALRMSLTHSQANNTFKSSPQWSEFLADSEYYPALESELGVLVRKYAWPLPFALVELWGHPDDLAAAAVKLVSKDRQHAEGRRRTEGRLRGLRAALAHAGGRPGQGGAPAGEPQGVRRSRHVAAAAVPQPDAHGGPAGTCEEGVKEFLKGPRRPSAAEVLSAPPAGDGAA
ncbi:unnamed protein product [Prorocentrum cordatum]|uniref:Uncharacterized protein n=1 Tax=Prorocentrum cordatum TaxID=2364126 RepID=A0ABN9TL28_9DINO|nr:unnamed protein product [Polarella glacialis]